MSAIVHGFVHIANRLHMALCFHADLSIALRHAGLCLNGGELQLLAREWPTVHSDQVDVLALVQAIESAFCTEY